MAGETRPIAPLPHSKSGVKEYRYPFNSRPPIPLKGGASASQVVESLRCVLTYGSSSKTNRVFGREDDEFKKSIVIFNGAVKSPAIALVKPRNADDVSRVIKFCRQHELEVSVKAGGTGVHGWSVAGHVILDLSLMSEIHVDMPGDAISLQDSFAQLKLQAESSAGPDDAVDGEEPPRRPSLSTLGLSNDSTLTNLSIKRGSADQRGEDGHDAKRWMDGDGTRRSMSDPSVPDAENGVKSPSSVSSGASTSRSNSHSGFGFSSISAYGNSNSNTSASASGSGRGSNNGNGKKNSVSSDGDPSPSLGATSSSSSSRSNSNVGAQPRVTYVNPSPTTATAHPFISTSFGGAGPSSASSSTSPFQQSFGGTSSYLSLNTNPDPPEYTIVTFGAGVNSKELDSTTAKSPYGAFHVPTSAFPVGSGQFTLGGFGFMGRKYGLAMDNVVEVEMVLSDGRIVWVGEGGRHAGEWKDHEDPNEVWWAMRGAGCVLGVITRFRAKAYYVPSVYAGNLIYVFDRETTPSLLRHVRDCVKGSPRTLYTNVILTAGPPGAPAIVVIQICASGSRSEGDLYVQAISSWDGGRCLFQDFSERTFERQQVAIEEVLKGGQGKKWYIKSDMLLSLDDGLIDETCARFHSVPDGCTWLFEYTGGGVSSEVKDSCYPKSHREGAFTVAALHQWGHFEPPDEDNRCVTTAEDWINQVVHPHSPGGPLPCFLQSSTKKDVQAVYGENFDRLAKVKEMVDPDHVFRHTLWPSPGNSPGEERQLGQGGEGVRAAILMDGYADKEGQEAALRELKGKGREQGLMGVVQDKAGSTGVNGANGSNGSNGADGADGLNHSDGTDGAGADGDVKMTNDNNPL